LFFFLMGLLPLKKNRPVKKKKKKNSDDACGAFNA
jgi:hypothetical protein